MSDVLALGNRILVEVEPELDKKSPGGIIIPDSVNDSKKKEATLGRVVELGPDVPDSMKSLVEPGMFLLFSKWAGTPLNIEGKEYLIVKSDEALAVLR